MRTTPEHGRRVYRCSSRETPSGPCGASRVPAEEAEAWVWGQVDAVLRDPSIIAAELRRQQEEEPTSNWVADREAVIRSLSKVEKQQERLIRRFREAEDDTFPWDLVEREITRAEHEKVQLRASLADVDRRIAEQQAANDRLHSLTT